LVTISKDPVSKATRFDEANRMGLRKKKYRKKRGIFEARKSEEKGQTIAFDDYSSIWYRIFVLSVGISF